ncbi:OmpP1/FadL family transporter [Dysgonomonas sp. 520]|uniref:OmpP1/FadL family transporter n=1 Tax=Dysgonomonas sp. 520 TaxID=2302931 RepID=UPI0013D36009|nr:outer membrane protein transport protein [Dysgonomonas sp. 520]NDW10412.1 hypothetical protein [Dysgonomonas sp. 520]
MKRFFISVIALSTMTYALAQGEFDAIKLAKSEQTGTARAMGMGGAFGALGGDPTGVAINPAGIGVYTKSEIVTTMNFSNNKFETELNAGKIDHSKFKFSFDNISYVGALPLNSGDVPYLNFGFAVNRIKSFDRKYKMNGREQNISLTDYMANQANGRGLKDGNLGLDAPGVWLETMGADGGLMDYLDDGTWESLAEYRNLKVNNALFVHEKGSIYSYDFNMGTTISNMLSIGVSVGLTDISYRMYSSYDESFGIFQNSNDGKEYDNGYELTNNLETDGTGYQVKAGLIFKPVRELRIGVAYHSPTWYDMTDYYGATLDHDVTEIASRPNYEAGYISTFEYNRDKYVRTDYQFRTPDKWVFSLAGVIGNNAILSLDYELTNYGNMSLKDDNGWALNDGYTNSYISEDFRTSSTIRAGAEFRFTPQFSARLGYSWVQSPYKKHAKESSFQIETANSTPNYSIDGDMNSFSYGMGYRFSPNFYTDIAFVYKTQKDDLYSFYGSGKGELKYSQFTGLLTFGYRF